MKKFLIILAIVIAIALAFFLIKKDETVEVEPTMVNVEKLELKDTENYGIYQGNLISRQSINIQPQVSGVISEIKVKAGDKVQKGQVLLIIDPKKQIALLETYKSQKPGLKAELETAKIQYERYQALYERKTVSKQEFENYKTVYEKAKSALNENEAQIKEQSEQLKYHTIVAPFSGTVGDIPSKTGELVTPESLLLSVTQNETLELNIGVEAKRVYELKKNLPIQILDYENKVINSSNIAFISPKVDSSTQTILVKAYFKNTDGILKADQTVKAKIIFNTEKNLLLPIGSTVHIAGGNFVYLIEEKDNQKIARQIPVVLGENQNGKFIVKSGLKEGDIVVIKGAQKLYDGAIVEIDNNNVGEGE